MRCPFCGHLADASRVTCAECGHALPPNVGPNETVFLSRPPSNVVASEAPTLAELPLAADRSSGPRAYTSGPFHEGQVINHRYRVIRLLGQGGMGAVYQAWDDELNVAVAIKTLLTHEDENESEHQETERRFKKELLLARAISHKNVVRIYDMGEIEGIKFISMPYIRGEDLATIIRKGAMPPGQALVLARQIASGLAAAHDAGVIHRDLKPANIMIENGERALLMDFGIARSVAVGTGPGTQGGTVVGTTEYMAPEQARGETVDGRADIYAFGLIVYEMLVGRRQISGESVVRDLVTRMSAPPPPARSIKPDVPEALDAIVTRCLQPEAEDRYQTTADLVAALDALDANGHVIVLRPLRATVVRLAIIALTLILAAAAITRVIVSRGSTPVAAREPVSVLIADFNNRAQDPVFDRSLEAALSVAMEGAPFITAFSRDAARTQYARLRPGSPFDVDGARLVSQREGVKVVLAGTIARDGQRYRLTVDAIDAIPGTVLTSAAAVADNKGDVLQAVGSVAARLRQALGDTTTETGKLAENETFTAASLEAAQSYARAQELSQAAKYEDAILYYRRALEQDPELGRAYSGWALAASNLGRTAEAESLFQQALARLDRMTEREKFRTLGLYYLRIARNPEKAIENFSLLVEKYPADAVALNNLGVAYFRALNFAKSLEYGKRLISIYPDSALWQYNYALYGMYMGEFDTARAHAEQALTHNADIPKAYVAIAMAALAGGDTEAARSAWQRAAMSGSQGASIAAMGLADIHVYRGEFAEADAALDPAIVKDRAAKNTAGTAEKTIVRAQAQQLAGNLKGAVALAQEALTLSRAEPIAVPAASVFVAAGRRADALKISGELWSRLPAQARAYAKVIEGDVALGERRPKDAIQAFTAALKLADLWLVRYSLGVAYVEAGAYREALSELETCDKRRGEATAVFLNDVPSWRYMAPLHYWLARAREGAGLKDQAAAGYKTFLALRPSSPNDPLVVDARRRLGA